MNTGPEIRTSFLKPSDTDQWNTVCRINGNLQQSTFYDPVQAYFRQFPFYVEVWQDKLLLGGSKFYIYTPGRFRKLTETLGKYVLQAGEAVFTPGLDTTGLFPLLQKEFEDFIQKGSPVWYTSYGYYDHPELLVHPQGKAAAEQSFFGNAFIEFNKNIDQLWDQIHPHHKHKILQAERKGYKTEQSRDIETFLGLLSSTYESQNHKGPNPEFLRVYFHKMETAGLARIYLALKDNKPVSGILVTLFGQVASYSFGGSLRNNDGASHLLQWNMIRLLAGEMYSQYYLGQVATDENSGDEKFQAGISPFKRRFGTREVLSSRKTFIFKPYSYRLWKMISKLAGIR
ncbi:MAG: GNAT family N-acetyltransferase [Bacteroidales bacterium]